MRETTFAGLTVIEPGDSPLADGGSFFARNPDLTDRLLHVGAVTHKHDAHAPLGNPTVPGSANSDPTGGTIGADVNVALCYTLIDTDGGETAPCPITSVTTDAASDPPFDVPSAAVEYTGGSLLINTYFYLMTFVDGAGGETPAGPQVSVTRDPGFASGQVRLTHMGDIAAAANMAGWRLYRGTAGQRFANIAEGSTIDNTFLDDGSECVNCDQNPPPGVGTTHSENTVTYQLPGSGAMPHSPLASAIRVYGAEDGDFTSPSLLLEIPLASAGALLTFPAIVADVGQPPDVSTCLPGANQIDPDTDILDWHWKRPVSTKTLLPAGSKGDVRLVTDSGALWGVLVPSASTWTDWSPLSGGGGGSGTVSRVFDKDGHEVIDPAAIEFVGGSACKARVYASGDVAVVQLDTPFYIDGDTEVLLWNDGFSGTIADLPLNYESDGYNAPNDSYYSYGGGGLERISTTGTSRLVAGASATGFLATDTRGRVKVKHLKAGGDYNVTVGINRVGSAVADQSRQDFIEVLYEGSTNWGFPRLSIIDSSGPLPPTFFDGSTIASAVVTDLGLNETGWVEIERVGRRVTARFYTSDPDLGAAPAKVIHGDISEARRAHLDASPAPGFFGFREGTANMLRVDDVKFWAARQEQLRVKLADVDRLVLAEDGSSDFFPTVSGSGGVPRLPRTGSVEFAGSGGTGVSVTDLGGGSARVLISGGGGSGSVGPQGPAGASGAIGPQGPTGSGTPGASGAAGAQGAAVVVARTVNDALDTVPAQTFSNLAHADQVHVDCGTGSGLVEIGGKGAVVLSTGAVLLGLFIDGVEAREVRDDGNLQPAAVEITPSTGFWTDGSPTVALNADPSFPLGSAAGFNFIDGDPVSYVLGPGGHTIEFRYKNSTAGGNGANGVKHREIYARVSAIGGGSATVGGSGVIVGGGGGGHTVQVGSAGAGASSLPQRTNLALGSGLTASDDPAHDATQVQVRLVRNIATVVTGVLASGWQASGVTGGSANADVPTGTTKGRLIYGLATDRPARVRVYASSGQRAADAGRAIGTDPTGDHGVLLDFVTIPTDTDWTLSPMVVYANMEPPVGSGYMPVRIDNLGASGAVQTNLTVLPLEF